MHTHKQDLLHAPATTDPAHTRRVTRGVSRAVAAAPAARLRTKPALAERPGGHAGEAGPVSGPLALTTRAGTWFAPDVAFHPRRREIEAHEAVHRAQFALAGRGLPASGAHLECEADRGARALLAGRPFAPQLSARPGAVLAYDPERVGDTTGPPPPGWDPPTTVSDKYAGRGYAYSTQNVVGRLRPGVTALRAMAILQERPNWIFPFTVKPLGGNASIRLGGIYDLRNVRFPGDSGNLVKVTAVSPLSFTFTTLEGHFDGPGATIRFTTYENEHWVVLRQDADAPNAGRFNAAVAPHGAIAWAWPKQAQNLARALAEDEARRRRDAASETGDGG